MVGAHRLSLRLALLLQVADVDELAHTVECTLGCDPNFKYLFNKHTQKYESRPHQFNCTYFSAVGRAFPQHRDRMYLMARVIQMFTPGIPMIYYVGLLAGENDLQVVLEWAPSYVSPSSSICTWPYGAG